MDAASERKPGPASDMLRLRRENFALAGDAVPPRNEYGTRAS